jgi:ribosome-interacting GTPase 1
VVDVAGGSMLDDVDSVRDELAKSKIRLSATGEEDADGFPVGTVFRPSIIVANKVDQPGARENLDIFEELYGSDHPIVTVSAQSGEGLEELKRRLFDLLGVVRVYTKIPGKPADHAHPFVLKRGSTVDDLAATVHKDFLGMMRFARAWGKNKPDGVMVGRDQELEDRDIIELHV